MRHGEFDEGVIRAAPRVAVVLSQDWCPQWTAMDRYLDELAAGAEQAGPPLVVFHLLYNRVHYFRQFLCFKEQFWRNALIPYVRYYREGAFLRESNFVSLPRFLRSLEP